ncbi:hypothetical protein AGIG_G3359 [Arapaima gigas]
MLAIVCGAERVRNGSASTYHGSLNYSQRTARAEGLVARGCFGRGSCPHLGWCSGLSEETGVSQVLLQIPLG